MGVPDEACHISDIVQKTKDHAAVGFGERNWFHDDGCLAKMFDRMCVPGGC